MDVFGIRSVDDKFLRMLNIWQSCSAEQIPIPSEVIRFFNNEIPDKDEGIRICLNNSDSTSEWKDDDEKGLEIDLVLLKKYYPQITNLRIVF